MPKLVGPTLPWSCPYLCVESITNLILDHSELLVLLFPKQIIQQCRLTSSKVIVFPYTFLQKYLSSRVVSKSKAQVGNASKPSKNVEKHSKTAKNAKKSQNCMKTPESVQNLQI